MLGTAATITPPSDPDGEDRNESGRVTKTLVRVRKQSGKGASSHREPPPDEERRSRSRSRRPRAQLRKRSASPRTRRRITGKSLLERRPSVIGTVPRLLGGGKGRTPSKGKSDAPDESDIREQIAACKGKIKDAKSKGKGQGSVGKAKSKQKPQYDDEQSMLSDATHEFHNNMCEVPFPFVDADTARIWRNEVFKTFRIKDDEQDRVYFMEGCFKHLSDLGKERSKRIYIGPGRDGSSDDKISVDCKFQSSTTKVQYSKTWQRQGLVKTSFIYQNDEWELIEDQVEITRETQLDERASRMCVIIHPPCLEDTANICALWDDEPEEELACFYCGHDELIIAPCHECGLSVCSHCVSDVGCTCMHDKDSYVAIDCFVPKPGQCKVTTLSRAQRKKVVRCCDTVKKQDDAMWAMLTGNVGPTAKKCLLAITSYSKVFHQAIGQSTTFIDPGPNGVLCDASMLTELRKTVEEQDPALLYIHVPFVNDNETTQGYHNLTSFATEQIDKGRTCIVADVRHTNRWRDLTPTLCRGDLAFHCNDKDICEELVGWAKARENGDPRCTDDLEEVQFADVLAGLAETHHIDKCVDAALTGTEEAAAEAEPRIIDAAFGKEDEGLADPADLLDDKQDLLEKLPLPGNPISEQTRKKLWLSLLRRARIVIRRLHRNFRHLPKNALVQMLRAAKVPKVFIEAAKTHRCDVCEATKPPPRSSKVARPKPYTFNHEVGIDVLEVKDNAGTFFDLFNVVDYGTTFEQASIVRAADIKGTPSSSSCLDAFVKGWVRPFGWPKLLAADRGLHNRGVFGQTMAKKGVRINPAALESPEQIGRVERRNQTLKRMLNKVKGCSTKSSERTTLLADSN